MTKELIIWNEGEDNILSRIPFKLSFSGQNGGRTENKPSVKRGGSIGQTKKFTSTGYGTLRNLHS